MKGLYTSCQYPQGSGGLLGVWRRADTHKPRGPPTLDPWVCGPPERGVCYTRNGKSRHLDGQEDIKLLTGILTVLHFSHTLPCNHSSLSEPAVRCCLTTLGHICSGTSSLWSVFAGSSAYRGAVLPDQTVEPAPVLGLTRGSTPSQSSPQTWDIIL